MMAEMSKQKLSIVIPAYNEENRLQGTLEEIFRKVGASFPFLEVIVVEIGRAHV